MGSQQSSTVKAKASHTSDQRRSQPFGVGGRERLVLVAAAASFPAPKCCPGRSEGPSREAAAQGLSHQAYTCYLRSRRPPNPDAPLLWELETRSPCSQNRWDDLEGFGNSRWSPEPTRGPAARAPAATFTVGGVRGEYLFRLCGPLVSTVNCSIPLSLHTTETNEAACVPIKLYLPK